MASTSTVQEELIDLSEPQVLTVRT